VKRFFIVFCPALFIHAVAWGDLLPTGFPGTFQDLPQQTRNEVIADGYRPFENTQNYQYIIIADEQKTPVEIPKPTDNTRNPSVTPNKPVSSTTTPPTLPPANPMVPSQTPGNPGLPVSYTPTQQSSVHDSQSCTNHTNNDANIIRKTERCNTLSGAEQTRCTKCVKRAGTYENGRCFVEILHWFCQGTGWAGQDSRSCPENYKYQGCGMIRKYVDVEQPFTCPQEGALSGCCQHGDGSGAKHPPFNVDGDGFYEMNCKMPLSSNLDWRVAYSNGSAIHVTGVKPAIRNWCMPSSKSAPWNDHNQPGGSKHCSTTISGGTTIQKWHTLN